MPAGLDSAQVKAAAARAGFSRCGVARAAALDPAALDRVLERGAEADMAWLRTQRAERLDPDRLLPGVKSVIALALAYHAGDPPPQPEGAGALARYAPPWRPSAGPSNRRRGRCPPATSPR